MSVTITALPPLDEIPEHARDLAQELLDLRVAEADAGQAVARLTSRLHGAALAAERADTQLAADAVRAGKDPGSAGTPNRDKHESERQAALEHRKAVRAAVAATSAELARALAGDTATGEWVAAMVADAAEGYRDALDHLADARRRFLSALAAGRFVDDAVACVRGARSTATYAPAAFETYAAGTAAGLRFDTVLDAMRSEAQTS